MHEAETGVAGLRYIQDCLNSEQQLWLLEQIDRQLWLTDLRRRVQHYGYRYDYKARSVDPATMYLGPLPDWVTPLLKLLERKNLLPETPDQLIVNEYKPGQGISPHVDCVPCFGETVLALSLGSSCVMEFSAIENSGKVALWLELGSLLIMQGEARYKWKHSIPARKTDSFQGQSFVRGPRVSLTFRNVITN